MPKTTDTALETMNAAAESEHHLGLIEEINEMHRARIRRNFEDHLQIGRRVAEVARQYKGDDWQAYAESIFAFDSGIAFDCAMIADHEVFIRAAIENEEFDAQLSGDLVEAAFAEIEKFTKEVTGFLSSISADDSFSEKYRNCGLKVPAESLRNAAQTLTELASSQEGGDV